MDWQICYMYSQPCHFKNHECTITFKLQELMVSCPLLRLSVYELKKLDSPIDQN